MIIVVIRRLNWSWWQDALFKIISCFGKFNTKVGTTRALLYGIINKWLKFNITQRLIEFRNGLMNL